MCMTRMEENWMVANKRPQRFTRLFLALGLALASAAAGSFTFPHIASADEFDREGEPGSFVYGGECGQLAQLTHRAMSAVVHSTHAENYKRFCTTEGVYSCEDYTPLLAGLGTLEGNGSIDCRFTPSQP